MPRKDPDEELDYAIDWSAELADKGDTADEFTWVVPDGITKVSESSSGGKAVIWLSGGTDGQDYLLTCRMATTAGRKYEQTMRIYVRSK